MHSECIPSSGPLEARYIQQLLVPVFFNPRLGPGLANTRITDLSFAALQDGGSLFHETVLCFAERETLNPAFLADGPPGPLWCAHLSFRSSCMAGTSRQRRPCLCPCPCQWQCFGASGPCTCSPNRSTPGKRLKIGCKIFGGFKRLVSSTQGCADQLRRAGFRGFLRFGPIYTATVDETMATLFVQFLKTGVIKMHCLANGAWVEFENILAGRQIED